MARAATGRRDDPPADRGPSIRNGRRPDELVERVRLGSSFRDQVRHDRIEGGTEERGSGAERGGDRMMCQSSKAPASDRTPRIADAHHAERIRGDHDAAAVEPVAHDPSEEQEDDLRHGDRDPIIASAVGTFESS